MGGIIGHCVGDALGLPVQFYYREDLDLNPIKEMVGYGSFNQPPGTWSDDSSLTFCLIESLIRGYNLDDQAQRLTDWLYQGYWSSIDVAFDIGRTTRKSINRYNLGFSPLECGCNDEYDNGNGSLMRILPLTFYTRDYNISKRKTIIHEVSGITHNHIRANIACSIYVDIGINLLKNLSPKEAYKKMRKDIKEYGYNECLKEIKYFDRILKEDIAKLTRDEIRSSGYVLDTIEAAIWCLLTEDSYKNTVLKAVNLGHDTDTTAAVAGGLAGIYYGYDSIPKKWIDNLVNKDEIIDLIDNFIKKI